MITYTHPIANKSPIKSLVARQLPMTHIHTHVAVHHGTYLLFQSSVHTQPPCQKEPGSGGEPYERTYRCVCGEAAGGQSSAMYPQQQDRQSTEPP